MIPQPPHPHHSHQHHHLHVTNLPHKWCVQWQVLMGGGWGGYPHYIVVPRGLRSVVHGALATVMDTQLRWLEGDTCLVGVALGWGFEVK